MLRIRSDVPALALLDDHRVEPGPGQGARGEGPARAGADHDDIAARLPGHSAAGTMFSGGSGRDGSWA